MAAQLPSQKHFRTSELPKHAHCVQGRVVYVGTIFYFQLKQAHFTSTSTNVSACALRKELHLLEMM